MRLETRELLHTRALAIQVIHATRDFDAAEFELAQFIEVSRVVAGALLQDEIVRISELRARIIEQGVQAE
jgi:hypothetical protein